MRSILRGIGMRIKRVGCTRIIGYIRCGIRIRITVYFIRLVSGIIGSRSYPLVGLNRVFGYGYINVGVRTTLVTSVTRRVTNDVSGFLVDLERLDGSFLESSSVEIMIT